MTISNARYVGLFHKCCDNSITLCGNIYYENCIKEWNTKSPADEHHVYTMECPNSG